MYEMEHNNLIKIKNGEYISMRLNELLKYDHIMIQCHDNPDADAIASGYGLLLYLREKGKDASLVYSGKFRIQKSNLVLMIQQLKIPIEHVRTLRADTQLLIMADCQYGEGNVTKLAAPAVIDIDHHKVHNELPEGSVVRSNIGSCSTVVWDLLRREEEDGLINDIRLGTALYYGLYTDTSFFTEISHPLDKDMRDSLVFDRNLIMKLRNSNMTLEELKIAGVSLLGYEYYTENRYAIFRAEPCDPNILGLISDFALEVDRIDVCLVYSILQFGIKFSVRSCEKEVHANELASYLAEGLGSAGGHKDKAGGMIDYRLLSEKDEQYSRASEDKRPYVAVDILRNRMDSYFHSYTVVYADKMTHNIKKMKVYSKLPVEVGYVKATDIFHVGNSVTIRMLEGDYDIRINDDTYIMIGILGEVYPITKDKFECSYMEIDHEYKMETEYEPTVRDSMTGDVRKLLPYVKSCIATGAVRIYARRLKKTTKIFTKWDSDTYMLGNPGDIAAIRMDDIHDTYIIRKDIFQKCYRKQ